MSGPWQDLAPFPGLSHPDLTIRACAERISNVFSISWTVSGADFTQLRVPAPAGANPRLDELWKKTCVEFFLRGDHGEDYLEYNVSPSGAWNAYHYTSYRTGGSTPPEAPLPSLAIDAGKGALEITCKVDLSAFKQKTMKWKTPWLCGVSAVMETSAGSVSYWALRHTANKPDFHTPESFVISLK